MELKIEQIQALKKEIEGIWTHLNNIEKQLTEKKEQSKDASGSSDSPDSPDSSDSSDSSGSPGSSTNGTIEMLERMKRKVDTWEQEAEQAASADLNQRIDEVLIQSNVKEALERLKQQLGIG